MATMTKVGNICSLMRGNIQFYNDFEQLSSGLMCPPHSTSWMGNLLFEGELNENSLKSYCILKIASDMNKIEPITDILSGDFDE